LHQSEYACGTDRRQIKRAKPRQKPYKLTDGDRLYLLDHAIGWQDLALGVHFQGRAKLMTFGKYPDVSLALARSRHADGRRLLATGVDPMTQRKTEKMAERIADENLFAHVARQWLEHWQVGKGPRHVDSTRRRLATNILPSLGGRPIGQIEAPEVVAMVRMIESRGARDIAKRAMEMTGQIFRYGIALGFTRRNPATEIRPSDILKASRKETTLASMRDLPALLRQIEIYQGTHITRLAIKLMALTFVRTSELIGASGPSSILKLSDGTSRLNA
jgi:hypothetical protein